MQKFITFIVTATCFLIIQSDAAADQFFGGTGLQHTQAALLYNPGNLAVTSHTRGYAKVIQNPEIGNFMLSDGTNAMDFTFGFSPHMEIGLSQILYQDLNLSGTPTQTINFPDDASFRLRWGNLEANYFNRSFLWGLFLVGRLNSGSKSGVYLEPYNSQGNEVELGYILSYYDNPLYPDENWNAHFNLSYVNHNDSGVFDKVQLFSGVTQQFIYSFGWRYPTLRWDFHSELYGNIFLNRPPKNAYSRANYMYGTLGTTFRLFQGLSFTISGEYNLFTSNITQYNSLPEGYPDFYPEWRLNGSIQFLSSTTFAKINSFAEVKKESEIDLEVRRQTGMTQKEMVDWLGSDQEGAEFIDLELEKIRAERKKAEQELEKLKEKIESNQSN